MSSLVQDAVAGIGRSEGPIDERPLNDDERKLVARLLSDPFAFPQTFKTWLVSFLEGSDLTLPISSISGLGATLGIGGEGNTGFITGLLPAGTILGWGSGRIPSGCLRCNGVAYSRTAYSRLFKEIGTSWGAGDGVTTFNVPDLRRRFPLGVGDTNYGLTHSDGQPEGSRGGPSHHHDFDKTEGFGASGYNTLGGGTDGGGGHSHSVNVSQASGKQIQQGTQGAFVWVAEQLVSSLGTSHDGDHSHGVSVGGTVNVNGSVRIHGLTSGGGQQDVFSFASIHFIIVT